MNAPERGAASSVRRPPPPLLRWVGPPPSPTQRFGILELTLGGESHGYFVQPIPSDFGTAYELTKFTKEEVNPVYHVLLDGRRSSCDCRGFQRWGHCKHLDALALLHAKSQLPKPPDR